MKYRTKNLTGESPKFDVVIGIRNGMPEILQCLGYISVAIVDLDAFEEGGRPDQECVEWHEHGEPSIIPLPYIQEALDAIFAPDRPE